MALPSNRSIPGKPASRLAVPVAGRGISASEIDWDKWTRHIESRRRRVGKTHPFAGLFSTRNFLATATYGSFRLEGLEVSETQVTSALATGTARRSFRSRQAQRLRNHVLALREIDARVIAAEPLSPGTFVRWYTSISCGLCPGDLSDAARDRLSEYIHRINFPELRLSGAIQKIAYIHRALLVDPLVPSFNGILSRLLLRFHLGRCGLPPVLFRPETPTAALTSERLLLPLLMELIGNSYDLMVAGNRDASVSAR